MELILYALLGLASFFFLVVPPVAGAGLALAGLLTSMVRLRTKYFARPHLLGASRALQLRFNKRFLLRSDEVRGAISEVALSISCPAGRSSNRFSKIEVKLQNVSAQVRILPRAWSPEGRLRTGDNILDRAFTMDGPEDEVLARLDHEARWRLLDLLPGVRIEAGKLRYESSEYSPLDAQSISEITHRVVAFAKVFDRPIPFYEDALFVNLSNDPSALVRVSNLNVLVERYEDSSATEDALELASGSALAPLRLAAALAQDRDVDFIEASALSVGTPPRLRCAAIERLTRHDRASALLPILSEPARGEGRAAWLTAVWALGRSGNRAAAVAMVDVSKTEPMQRLLRRDFALAKTLIVALGRLQDPVAESLVMRFLHTRNTELSIAAATALGRVGSGQARAALRELSRRWYLDEGLIVAARTALQRLESNVDTTARGQLALVDSQEEGALSIGSQLNGGLSES